jgi:GTP-binding protein
MKFVDEADIEVHAGNGGAGCISFLREKYRPKGGPDGGNGGDGGDVILDVDLGLSTLLDFKYQRRVAARNGEPGRGKQQHGKCGTDVVVHVPLGTVVRDRDTEELVADLCTPDARAVVARGGRGGRGNATYATSTNQAPRRAQPGIPGEERRLRLELRLVADVGLLGFPNVGKSTFIRRVSAARPRVADYPFTTLVPHLGVVRFADEGSFVLADIPGLIAGAHEGQGLGLRFLRHVSRTSMLLHVLDASELSGRDPLDDFAVINRELARFDAGLAARPQIVALNKIDVADPGALDELERRFRAAGIEPRRISAATGAGVNELVQEMGRRVQELRRQASCAPIDEADHG